MGSARHQPQRAARRFGIVGARECFAEDQPRRRRHRDRIDRAEQAFERDVGHCSLASAVNAVPGETAPRHEQIGRLLFGLCLLAFGTAHLIYMSETAAMVPAWLPVQNAVAIATGAAHILAGRAFISGVQALLASRLLVAMYIDFGLLVWLPQILADPYAQMAWAGNAINLALIGAAWVLADSIAARRTP